MAGDWIKVRVNLPDDPAVFRMASVHGCSTEQVVGHLIRIWAWATDQLEDGHARNVTLSQLDAVARVTGFGQSMVDVGWLVVQPDGLLFPRWERHLSQGAKQRVLATERKRKEREVMSRVCHAESVTETRPEKRREEERRIHPAPERQPDKNVLPAPARASEDFESSNAPTMGERSQVRQALVRVGVESGAAQQVSLHPMLTLAMVKSNFAAVKKDNNVKSKPAVLLTRLRKELGMIE